MKQDESFGIIPLRKHEGHWQVFLVLHKHAKYWGFPKGHAEAGETAEQAAARELKEETNLDVVRHLAKEPLSEQYRFTHGQRYIVKRVLYYIAEVAGTVKLQENEIESGVWVDVTDAAAKVTHSEGKSIIGLVEKFLREGVA
jgi:8-oxo-dGTP pyrophosphatase MutT (NUDIX family)